MAALEFGRLSVDIAILHHYKIGFRLRVGAWGDVLSREWPIRKEYATYK